VPRRANIACRGTRNSFLVLPVRQLFESRPGASYWTPLIFRSEEYSVAWAGVTAATATVPVAAATASTERMRMRSPLSSVVRLERQEHTQQVTDW
jgi:hypothetical protein